jgi:hypothetical protein
LAIHDRDADRCNAPENIAELERHAFSLRCDQSRRSSRHDPLRDLHPRSDQVDRLSKPGQLGPAGLERT